MVLDGFDRYIGEIDILCEEQYPMGVYGEAGGVWDVFGLMGFVGLCIEYKAAHTGVVTMY